MVSEYPFRHEPSKKVLPESSSELSRWNFTARWSNFKSLRGGFYPSSESDIERLKNSEFICTNLVKDKEKLENRVSLGELELYETLATGAKQKAQMHSVTANSSSEDIIRDAFRDLLLVSYTISASIVSLDDEVVVGAHDTSFPWLLLRVLPVAAGCTHNPLSLQPYFSWVLPRMSSEEVLRCFISKSGVLPLDIYLKIPVVISFPRTFEELINQLSRSGHSWSKSIAVSISRKYYQKKNSLGRPSLQYFGIHRNMSCRCTDNLIFGSNLTWYNFRGQTLAIEEH